MSNENDPRFLRSRDTILATARELLREQGPAAVTHNQIAEHAGIGRATVYRHWPRTDELLAEAMASVPMPFFAEPTSPIREWLARELAAIARQLEHDDVLAVTTTLANSALWDEAMDARRAGFAEILSTRLLQALEEAERLGELSTRPDAGAAARVIGPIYYRATIERSPADPGLIDACTAAAGNWATA
jgi:AcrR family transcriptional regulator